MSNISTQDLAELLTLVLIEVVAALQPVPEIASEKLEDIAGRLLDAANGLIPGTPRDAVLALAQQLIKTEPGAGPIRGG